MKTMCHMSFVLRTLSFVLALTVSVAANAAAPISPGGVFRAGATAALSIGAADDTWCVLDAAAYPSNEVVVASGTTMGAMLRIPHKTLEWKLGAYVLRSWQSGGSETNETRFAFIPPGDVRPAPWVGTCFHLTDYAWGGGDVAVLKQFSGVAAEAGIGMVRTGPKWAECEKTPGVYSLPGYFEPFLDDLVARGMSFCCDLHYGNATAYPQNPIDATAFANWAAWMADTFAGRIDTYEIWNEPSNFQYYQYYTNLVEECAKTSVKWTSHFANFTRTVDDALAGRGLRVLVGGGDWYTPLYNMIEAGIARSHNFVDVHPYHSGRRPEQSRWLEDGFLEITNRLAAAGAAGAGIAITEVGWTTYDGDDGVFAPSTSAEQARNIVRMYLVAMVGGAEFSCQYDFKDDGKSQTKRGDNWGLLDYWGHPKPAYAAVAAMTRFVGDAEFVEELSTNAGTYRLQRFDRADGVTNFVAWSVEGDRTVAISQDVRNALRGTVAYDIYGNKIASPRNGIKLHLTEAPVYFVKGASEAGDGDSPWGPPWAIAAMSEPTTIYANACESLLWHTTPFGGTTVRWDKPATATSATLTVESHGYSRTYANLTGESCDIILPGGVATADGEDVYTLTLAFDDGTIQTAWLGAVTGLGTGGPVEIPKPKDAASPSWPKFRDRAVIPIPAGATALTVNGEPLPGLDGSAGWRSIRQAPGVEEYNLSLTMESEPEPVISTLSAKPYTTFFIMH